MAWMLQGEDCHEANCTARLFRQSVCRAQVVLKGLSLSAAAMSALYHQQGERPPQLHHLAVPRKPRRLALLPTEGNDGTNAEVVLCLGVTAALQPSQLVVHQRVQETLRAHLLDATRKNSSCLVAVLNCIR